MVNVTKSSHRFKDCTEFVPCNHRKNRNTTWTKELSLEETIKKNLYHIIRLNLKSLNKIKHTALRYLLELWKPRRQQNIQASTRKS